MPVSKPPQPSNELLRLDKLHSLKILDSGREALFDCFTALASEICRTPICAISLVDKERQWFKSSVGLAAEETPRDIAFCGHSILQATPLIVEDALADSRFQDNELVLAGPKIRFYAGAPLITNDGYALGAICVIDQEKRELDSAQTQALSILASLVVTLIETRGKKYSPEMKHGVESELNNQFEKLRQLIGTNKVALSLIETAANLVTVSFGSG